MRLSFQNFYAFEFTLGFLGVISGLYALQFSLFFILLIFLSGFMIFNSVVRWNKSQETKESLEELNLERNKSEIDFDIEEVTAENDVDWYPDEVINGKPVGFNEIDTVTYKIKLNAYNPCVIENVIRNIDIEVVNREKKANMKTSSEDINRIPVSIEPRTHKKLVFYASVEEMKGKKGDKLRITLTSMDNKKVKKDYEIKHYSMGSNLRNRFP